MASDRGFSRSPSFIIAYLIDKYKYSFEEAYKLVSDKKSININEGILSLQLFMQVFKSN